MREYQFLNLREHCHCKFFDSTVKEYIDAAEAAAASKLRPAVNGVESPIAETVSVVQEVDQQLWEETWEDDDDTPDFSSILAKEHEKRKIKHGVRAMDLD